MIELMLEMAAPSTIDYSVCVIFLLTLPNHRAEHEVKVIPEGNSLRFQFYLLGTTL